MKQSYLDKFVDGQKYIKLPTIIEPNKSGKELRRERRKLERKNK